MVKQNKSAGGKETKPPRDRVLIVRPPPDRLLIVEHDKQAREGYKALCQRWGYNVLAVASAEEALTCFSDFRPAILVADIDLPGMDGLTLLSRLGDELASVPAIIITGKGSEERAVAAIDYGAFWYLEKPLMGSVMHALLERAVRAHKDLAFGELVRIMKSERKDAEAKILRKLGTLVPTAAASYQQVLVDIQRPQRLSYRGTAAELREVLRELLDHLAPDADVMSAQGFSLELGQRIPTMKQKVRHILRERSVGDSRRQTAEHSVDHIASLGRALYTRGSSDVHRANSLEEVLNFKAYVDALLAELLAIHKSNPASLREENEDLRFSDNTGPAW